MLERDMMEQFQMMADQMAAMEKRLGEKIDRIARGSEVVAKLGREGVNLEARLEYAETKIKYLTSRFERIEGSFGRLDVGFEYVKPKLESITKDFERAKEALGRKDERAADQLKALLAALNEAEYDIEELCSSVNNEINREMQKAFGFSADSMEERELHRKLTKLEQII